MIESDSIQIQQMIEKIRRRTTGRIKEISHFIEPVVDKKAERASFIILFNQDAQPPLLFLVPVSKEKAQVVTYSNQKDTKILPVTSFLNLGEEGFVCCHWDGSIVKYPQFRQRNLNEGTIKVNIDSKGQQVISTSKFSSFQDYILLFEYATHFLEVRYDTNQQMSSNVSELNVSLAFRKYIPNEQLLTGFDRQGQFIIIHRNDEAQLRLKSDIFSLKSEFQSIEEKLGQMIHFDLDVQEKQMKIYCVFYNHEKSNYALALFVVDNFQKDTELQLQFVINLESQEYGEVKSIFAYKLSQSDKLTEFNYEIAVVHQFRVVAYNLSPHCPLNKTQFEIALIQQNDRSKKQFSLYYMVQEDSVNYHTIVWDRTRTNISDICAFRIFIS